MSARKTPLALVLVTAAAFAASGAYGQTARPAASVAASSPPSAQAAARSHRFHGTVTAVRRGHWVRLHIRAGRNVRIYATRGTRWSGCDWDDMRYGNHMDVRAYRSHGRWMASLMQRWHGDWHDGWDDMGPGMMG